MNIMQTPVTGVSFSGEVKGKKDSPVKHHNLLISMLMDKSAIQ